MTTDISIDQVQALLPSLSKQEQQELTVAAQNTINTVKAMLDSPTTATIANHRAAKEFLAEIYADKFAKYRPPEEPASIPGDAVFRMYVPTKTRLDVYRFLAANGWGISQRTFYRHVDTGKLKKNKDGLYSARAVKKYAETWAVRTSGQTIIEEEEDLAASKTRAEIDRIRTIQEREAFRLNVEKGKFFPRDDLEMELAARAVALEASFDHMVYTKATEVIAVAGGKPENAELVIAFLLMFKDEWFKHYASVEEFVVVFPGDGK